MTVERYFRYILICLVLCIIGLAVYHNRSYKIYKSLQQIATSQDDTRSTSTFNSSSWISSQNGNNRTEKWSSSSTKPPPAECPCKPVVPHGSTKTVENLDTLLPWLNDTIKEDITKHHPNFPVEFFFNASKGKACSLIPTIFSIEWRNRIWQELRYEENEKFLMYSAFYDPNPAHLDWQGRNSNRQMPYLLTCPLPPGDTRVPAAVSLVTWPCTPASNLLKVVGARERESSAYEGGTVPKDLHSKNIRWTAAVCGPALYYYSYDWSRRLVEWIEIHRAVGFGRVFVYNTGVHPNMEKVLQYYEKEGFVHVTHYSFPPPYTDEPSLHRLWTDVERHKLFAQENIFYTDCPLRHMHQYRYLAHLDADELPILRQHHSYTDFIQRLRNNTPDVHPGFKLQWSMFYNDLEPQGKAASLPEYLWVLRHTRRPAADIHPTPGQFKTLYDMDTARGMFAHGVVWCTTGLCTHGNMRKVPTSIGYIGHFSRTCGEKCKTPHYTKEDLTLQRYRDQVSKAVEKTLKELQFL